MAEAYLDESGHEAQPGYYGVAGFIGSDHQWREFTRIWNETLTQVGAPYVHMREFAHSVNAFAGWRNDPRREQLMAGVIRAITESRLTAVGSALRMADFNSLTEDERVRFGGSPYFGCLQDVLYGFALTSQDMPVGELLTITADQNDDQHQAQGMYDVLRQRGVPYDRLAPTLNFANMRQTPGIQGADVLAYEIIKELSNQDRRPEDQMRWPLDQILTDQGTRDITMVVYRNRAYLHGQVNGIMDTNAGKAIVDRDIDEMMRIYRLRNGPSPILARSPIRKISSPPRPPPRRLDSKSNTLVGGRDDLEEEESTSTFDDQVAYYLQSLSGPDYENTYHRLIELGPAVIPYLESEFKIASDPRVRQVMVKIAWRTQSRQSLPLLQNALEDAHDHVWKEALDGLVSIGGQEALETVRQVRGRSAGDKLQWIHEAIQQITEKL